MKKQQLWNCAIAAVLSTALVMPGGSVSYAKAQNETVVKALSTETTADAEVYLTISSARELNEFAQKVNNGNDYEGKIIQLTNDIEFDGVTINNFTEIGDSTYQFNGIFDGAGYTIKGINVTKNSSSYQIGLFGYIGASGVVKNVTIADSEFIGIASYAGGIAGYSVGTIYNCHNKNTKIAGKKRVGGIAGENRGTIINCISSGEVSLVEPGTFAACGGIAGCSADTNGNSKIYNSGNSGNISVPQENSDSIYVGGIVGEIGGTEVQNCYNVGSISKINSSSNKKERAGGVVGYGEKSAIVANCYTSEEAYTSNFGTMLGTEKNVKALPKEEMKTDTLLTLLNTNRGSNSDWLEWEFRSESEYPLVVKLMNISRCEVTLDKTSYGYTGKAITPDFKVTDGETELEKDQQYSVSYQNNENAGTAKIIITGIGKYFGTIEKTFTIKKGSQKIAYKSSYKKTYKSKAFKVYAKRVKGDGKLTYKSSNKKVATVDSKGKVTVKKKGKAVITVTAASTKNYNKKSVKITVYVSKK